MQLSPATTALVAQLRLFSNNKLTRENDLGMLLDLAAQNQRESPLENLCFYAKFVSRAYRIMNRIGRGGEGYDKLLEEFNSTLSKACDLAQGIVSAGPQDVRQHFAAAYFAVTPEALDNVLALFYDLGWYKNWLIDHRR